jgi:small-conductance mechanosensitive channel
LLLVLFALLAVSLIFEWTTRDAMGNLSFLNSNSNAAGAKKTIVDTRPWQTAQALAPLAMTAEETEHARDAERLADHEVDQAFASALRQATQEAQHRTLTGEALALSQRIAQLQQLIAQDKAQVESITAQLNSPANRAKNGAPFVDQDDLEVAKAQLGLDSDELADAQQDLDRASGDQTSQIQAELNAHEASMSAYDKQVHAEGQIAVISERQHGTMAGRVKAWFSQRDRYGLLQQALNQTRADIVTLTAQHNSLEAKANAGAQSAAANSTDRAVKLADIKDRSVERQILSITDDRIQTDQQLATVYSKWAAQVQLQHRIVLHLILRSLALITLIGICMVLCDALVRRLMANPALDHRRSRTLRSILELSIQVVGVVLILLVIFGMPRETPTILGLATAALTIALQDFIIAFLGWFVLIGKNGIHVGDWVEINGVGGEVIDVWLFSTTLLETGEKGLPTGRRITFMNGYAIRGQYFNFSTSGQWMWDEITLSLPASDNVNQVLDRIQQAVVAETGKNAELAEQEWKRGARGSSLSHFSATAVESLRPSASGIDVLVRYVTRASERFELRNRLYQKLLEVLHQPVQAAGSTSAAGTPNG